MNHSKYTRFLSMLLAVVMVIGYMPVSAFATETEENKAPETATVYFDVNGGIGEYEDQVVTIGEKVTKPEQDPTHDSYEFAYWTANLEEKIAWNFEEDVVAEDMTLYAAWSDLVEKDDEGDDTTGDDTTTAEYKVEHQLQTAEGYALKEFETLTGTIGEQTEAVAKTYEGYTALEFAQATILADGTTVVVIRYDADPVAIEEEQPDGVINKDGKFGYNGYYNVISEKNWTLVPGAAEEYEIVLNNDAGTRRQVLHIIEVDPSNPDISIVPGYYQIDKDLEDEANWSHKELTEMAKYYENTLGYNIVGGMNTDLYYSSYSPRVLVYNGKWIGNAGENVATGGAVLGYTSSILYVFKDAEGNVSCDVKAFNKAEVDKYLKEGILLHAVGVSFGMVVKDGALVNTTEKRGNDDAARSMVGVKEDGTLVICMNDGRGANNSVGFSSFEEGEAMLALGCKWAANCDGGGSSTFLTKRAGEETFTMRSVPCDGAQRPTAHGIFVVSNVGPTGELDVVNVTAGYDIFAPKTVYTFGAEAIDTHGYAMAMPADVTWTLSDASFGTIEGGKFVSNGTKGTVEVQVLSGGNVVGTKTITVADPAVFDLSASSTTIPYSTADKVRSIQLPIVAMTGEANVYVDTNAVTVSLDNEAAGTLNGFNFIATTDTSISGVNVTVTYGETTRTYAIAFGKGSEIIFDFEDGDKAGFMGFEEAKKWSQDNGVNNTLVGSAPLAGQFNEYLSSETFVASTTNGGQVRNGNYALAWRLDNTDAAFASWSYNVLFNTSDEVIVLRDVANDMMATTLGMWLYIPEEAFQTGTAGVAFQSQLYVKNADGKYSCVQDHFLFTSAATGNKTNLNSATNADIPESRWVYATINISKYDYLCMPVATDESNSRSPSFVRTYVKPTFPAEITFYIDDITLDYSSAVDDRILPTITNPTYSTSDTAVSLENGKTYTGTDFAFSATVADNAALDLTSGKIFVDGIEVSAAIAGGVLSTKEDVKLNAGTHTVIFEVKDELGNPMKVTRTFTVAGDAVVSLTGHNDSGEAPKAQSVYYVDINVADLANVTSLEAQLKLNNANTWDLDGANVAPGFKATFSYNEISELLTVTVERDVASSAETLSSTLVSIPVRVWTYNRFNYVNGTYYDPVKYAENDNTAAGTAEATNKPVVNIDVDVVYGTVNGAPFGGAIDVATELTTISSPYHVHDAELIALDQELSCTTDGYQNRTYCETCKSVVDWGTKIEASGHDYQLLNGSLVCTVCESTYNAGNGLFTMNDKLYYAIAGKLVSGWQNDGEHDYYLDPVTYTAVDGQQNIGGHNYVFENNVLIEGSIVRSAEGKAYYMWAGQWKTAGRFNVGEKTYWIMPNRELCVGRVCFAATTNSPLMIMDFDSNGVLLDEHLNGVVAYGGQSYYVIDSKVQVGSGAIEVDGDIYYIRSSAVAATGKYYVAPDKTNGILEEGYYLFGADGKLVKNAWSTEWDGTEKHIVNGRPAQTQYGLVVIGEDIYYIRSNGQKATGRYYVGENRLNGILDRADDYVFDSEGRFIKEGWSTAWDGTDKYIVNGKPAPLTYGLMVVQGEIYYIRSNGQKATGRYYVGENRLNGILDRADDYLFDSEGRFIKEGWSSAWDGTEKYVLNGKPAKPPYGLIVVQGEIYYIRSNGQKATGRYYVGENRLNGILDKSGIYLFDDTGKLILE